MEVETTGTASVLALVSALATVALAFFLYNRNVINATTAALRSQQKTTLDATARARLVKDLLKEEAEQDKRKKKTGLLVQAALHSPTGVAAAADSQVKKNTKNKKGKARKSVNRSSESFQPVMQDETSSSPGSSSADYSDDEGSLEDLLLLSSLSSGRLNKAKILKLKSSDVPKKAAITPVETKPIHQTKELIPEPVRFPEEQPAIVSAVHATHVHSKVEPVAAQPSPKMSSSIEAQPVKTKMEDKIKSLEQQLMARQPDDHAHARREQIQNIIAERDALANELAVLKDTNRVMTQSLVSCQHNLRESSKKMRIMEGEIESFRQMMERAGKVEESLEIVKRENSQLVLQVSEAQQYVKNMRTENSRLQQLILNYEEASGRERAAHAASVGDANKTIATLKAQINSFDAEITCLLKSKSTDQEDMVKLSERFRTTSDELTKLNEEKRSWMDERKKVMEETAKLQENASRFLSEKEILSDQLAALKKQMSENDDMRIRCAEKDALISSLRKQLMDLEVSKQTHVDKLLSQIKELESRANTVGAKDSQKLERLSKEVEQSKTRSDISGLHEALSAQLGVISFLSGTIEAKHLEIEALKSQKVVVYKPMTSMECSPAALDQSKETSSLNQRLEQTHQELCKSIETCTGQTLIMSALYRELETMSLCDRAAQENELVAKVKSLEKKNNELASALKESVLGSGQNRVEDLNLALREKDIALAMIQEEKGKLELEKSKLHKMCLELLQKRKEASVTLQSFNSKRISSKYHTRAKSILR